MPKVECPCCGEQFFVVYPDEEQSEKQKESRSTTLDASVVSWNMSEARHPYPAETEMDEDQIKQEIQRVQATLEINGKRTDFEFFQKSEDQSYFWTHVVRADTDAGRKSKNTVVSDDGELYVKNRGVPWNADKQWTYLSKGQLQERSKIAGLGGVVEIPESEGGLGLSLDEKNRPLVVSGDLQTELVRKLAKALLVMQSRENPVKQSV